MTDTEALKALVAACEKEFCSPATEGGELVSADDESVMGPGECAITFGKIRAARAALERMLAFPDGQEPVAWLPIETAPKTGEHILVAEFNPERIGFGFCGGKKQSMMTVAHWWDAPGEEGWYASVDSQGEYPFPATHWKPLNEL